MLWAEEVLGVDQAAKTLDRGDWPLEEEPALMLVAASLGKLTMKAKGRREVIRHLSLTERSCDPLATMARTLRSCLEVQAPPASQGGTRSVGWTGESGF